MKLLKKTQFAAVNENFKYWPFLYFLDTQKQLGVKSVEIWAGPPHVAANDEWHQPGGMYRELVESRGMEIAACSSEYAFSRQYFFCSYDRLAQELALAQYRQIIDFTNEAGAKILTVNCAGGVRDEDSEKTFGRAAAALKNLGDYAAEKNVTLAVETMPPSGGNITHTLMELQRLVSRVNHPAVKVCLNTESMCCAGETIQQWFDAFGKEIVHIHFTDGKPGGRLAWGDGLLPLEAFLRGIRENGYTGPLGINTAGYWQDPAAAAARNYASFDPYFE